MNCKVNDFFPITCRLLGLIIIISQWHESKEVTASSQGRHPFNFSYLFKTRYEKGFLPILNSSYLMAIVTLYSLVLPLSHSVCTSYKGRKR